MSKISCLPNLPTAPSLTLRPLHQNTLPQGVRDGVITRDAAKGLKRIPPSHVLLKIFPSLLTQGSKQTSRRTTENPTFSSPLIFLGLVSLPGREHFSVLCVRTDICVCCRNLSARETPIHPPSFDSSHTEVSIQRRIHGILGNFDPMTSGETPIFATPAQSPKILGKRVRFPPPATCTAKGVFTLGDAQSFSGLT